MSKYATAGSSGFCEYKEQGNENRRAAAAGCFR
jgi:hypothetical protein